MAIIWNKNFKGVTPLHEVVHDRICGVQVQIDNDTVINIFCIYLPARGGLEDPKVILDEMAGILEVYGDGAINIIAGDLNGDIGTLGGPRSLKTPTKEGKILHRYIEDFNMVATNMQGFATGPINTFSSYMGTSCLDYILIHKDMEHKVKKCLVIEDEANNTSDHDPVLMTFSIDGCIKKVNVVKKRRVNWSKLSQEVIFRNYTTPVQIDLTQLIEQYRYLDPNIDVVDDLVHKLVTTLRRHEANLPTARFRQNVKPYWCRELDDLKKVKVENFKRWKEAGRPRDRNNRLRQANLESKKLFRRRLKRISKEYEEQKITEAIHKFWRMLKGVRTGKKASINTVKNKFEKVVSDPAGILEVWREHFSSLCTPKNLPRYDEDHFQHVTDRVSELMEGNDGDRFTEEDFSKDDIIRGINKLNPGKVPGEDGITKEHLVAGGMMVVEVLFILFKWILQLERIPANFRKGVQVPLYKGKNASTLDTNNYRGITLLNTLNK